MKHTDEEIRAQVVLIQDEAREYGMSSCVLCHIFPMYEPHGYAVCKGHIYSQAGIDEFNISRCCEYCFDNAFGEE